MGVRSVSKYMSMAMAGMFIFQKGMSWYNEAKSSDSPGGEEITPEELVELDDLLTEALQAVGVPVKIKAEWLGD